MFNEECVIERLKTVDSTNKYIEKYLKKRTPAVVRADKQTAGRGTKGRSFISDEGGLYFSRLTYYTALPAREAFKIMIDYAVGVVKTLKAFGVESSIKWPNDVLVNGKKICGILIKNGFCGDFVDYSIVGIGLNVNNQIAKEIKDIATSMKKACGKEFDLEQVFFSLLQNVSVGSNIAEYRTYSAVIGKKIKVFRDGGAFDETALSVTDDGRLVLANGEVLSAAELDLKIGF